MESAEEVAADAFAVATEWATGGRAEKLGSWSGVLMALMPVPLTLTRVMCIDKKDFPRRKYS
jgi:hypothetical protein